MPRVRKNPLAAALSAEVRRAGDLFARYGGEEFACLMPAVDVDGAETVARRMCAAVRGLHVRHEHPAVMGNLSISVGVAAVIPSCSQGSEVLVREADRQLYAAKNSGRNRLCAGTMGGRD